MAGGQIALLSDLETGGSLTAIGLTLPIDITYSKYEALGALLGYAHESMKYAVGDWLAIGERLFPEEAAQASEALGLSSAQRLQYIRVATDVPIERRVPGLTWSHHRAVAPLEPDEQRYWLAQAKEKGWSKAELEEHLRQHRKPVEVKEHQRGNPHVVEEVVRAAELVYEEAEIMDDRSGYTVPLAPMQALGRAFGEGK